MQPTLHVFCLRCGKALDQDEGPELCRWCSHEANDVEMWDEFDQTLDDPPMYSFFDQRGDWE